jgi:hypothetical protein
MDLETRVKLFIYETIAQTTKAPAIGEVATALGIHVPEAEAAFRGLSGKRLLVLERDTLQIRMAPPFSAIATPFRVVVKDKSYSANCAWDALGIAAALHGDAHVYASCGDCDEPISLEVRDGSPVTLDWVAHFAVPAAHWWDDIIYT